MRTVFLALALALAFAVAAASGATSTGRSRATSSAKNGEIAFSAHVHGIAQVFTVNPNGTGLRQITHGTANAGDNGLSWSPDGRSLLYTLSGPDIDRIVKSGADGSAPTVISASCTGTCLGDDDPVYSPDGSKIAFVRAYGPILANGNASDVGIYTMNADGSDLTQLTQQSTPTSAEDHSPQWSPNGTKIAFVRINTTAQPSNGTAIMVMNADGSNVKRITPFRISASRPHWSPDGKQLLFRNHENGVQGQSGNLFTMHADGTHRVQLTHYSGGYLQGVPDAWSPDGTQILFRRLRFSGTDTQVGGFYILNLRSKQIRRLTPVRIRYDTEAAWGKKPGK
jgi:Tol biopolymer transport system component